MYISKHGMKSEKHDYKVGYMHESLIAYTLPWFIVRTKEAIPVLSENIWSGNRWLVSNKEAESTKLKNGADEKVKSHLKIQCDSPPNGRLKVIKKDFTADFTAVTIFLGGRRSELS